ISKMGRRADGSRRSLLTRQCVPRCHERSQKIERREQRLAADWQHCTPLERMYAVRQGYAEKDGVGRRRRRRMQLLEAAGSIKPDGPQVSGTYREVGAVRAHFLDR